MDELDDEPTETPTNTVEQAEAEGAWMTRNWIAIASISILALLVLALAMLQVTGLIDAFAPIAGTEIGQWTGIALIAAAVVAIAAWGWRSVIQSNPE